MVNVRNTAVIVGILSAGLVLTGCSASPDAPGTDTGHGATTAPTSQPGDMSAEFNDPDVAFATNMIPHHEQAVEMAQMVLDKQGIDPRVTALAEKIKAAQSPEITTMTAWLTAWGASVPVAMSDMPGMPGMDGLMSQSDMAALKSATGAAASALFLRQMTQHHQGAITMAKEEIQTGKNPDAISLATKIESDQKAEIGEMAALLAAL